MRRICDEENILNEIASYANLNLNEEICGVIVKEGCSRKFIKCDNKAIDKQKFFEIDFSVFIEYLPEIIVHSHCLGSAKPSLLDKTNSKYIGLPFLIYSTLHDNFCLYENNSVIEFKV